MGGHTQFGEYPTFNMAVRDWRDFIRYYEGELGLHLSYAVGKCKMLCKTCNEHKGGKTCTEVYRLGLCLRNQCYLFKRVKQFFLKNKKYNEMVARGVIPYTVWDFSEKGIQQHEKQIERAKKWLERYGSMELT